MSNKVIYLLVGLVITGAVMVGLVLFLSRPDTLQPPQEEEEVFSSSDINTIRKETSGLQNYGDLPYVISADQMGRENPFDAYK